MHGENYVPAKKQIENLETPPYARGKLPGMVVNVANLRNTPVCTGKTLSNQVCLTKSGKHPRMHGENTDI